MDSINVKEGDDLVRGQIIVQLVPQVFPPVRIFILQYLYMMFLQLGHF